MLVNITDGSASDLRIQLVPEAGEDDDVYVKQTIFHIKCMQGVDNVGLLDNLPPGLLTSHWYDGATKIPPHVCEGFFQKETQLQYKVKVDAEKSTRPVIAL